MRFEIIVPDTTKPELHAQFVLLTQKLSAHPELVGDCLIDEDATIQAMFTPERLALINRALAEANSGKFFTSEQVKEHFAKKEVECIARPILGKP